MLQRSQSSENLGGPLYNLIDHLLGLDQPHPAALCTFLKQDVAIELDQVRLACERIDAPHRL